MYYNCITFLPHDAIAKLGIPYSDRPSVCLSTRRVCWSDKACHQTFFTM